MKTVLIDMNNLMMRMLFSGDVLISKPDDKYDIIDYDWNMFEFKIFSSVFYYMSQAKKCTELVLAIDGKRKDTWRNLKWPRYKDNRKKPKKNEYNIDWKEVNAKYLNLMTEILNNFPIKCIRCNLAEADDVIASIVMNTSQKHHIISSDKDYIQLYEPNRVAIFSPTKKDFMKHPNTELFVVEQSLIGQVKDNIFNIKTPLDYPDEKRKPGFGPKAAEKVFVHGYKKWLKENNLEERFEFNRTLLDFKRIPKDLQEFILKKYNSIEYPHADKMYKYLEKKNWTEFLDDWTWRERIFMELF